MAKKINTRAVKVQAIFLLIILSIPIITFTALSIKDALDMRNNEGFCLVGMFRCSSTSQTCIEQQAFCDGHQDCPGGEDEQDSKCMEQRNHLSVLGMQCMSSQWKHNRDMKSILTPPTTTFLSATVINTKPASSIVSYSNENYSFLDDHNTSNSSRDDLASAGSLRSKRDPNNLPEVDSTPIRSHLPLANKKQATSFASYSNENNTFLDDHNTSNSSMDLNNLPEGDSTSLRNYATHGNPLLKITSLNNLLQDIPFSTNKLSNNLSSENVSLTITSQSKKSFTTLLMYNLSAENTSITTVLTNKLTDNLPLTMTSLKTLQDNQTSKNTSRKMLSQGNPHITSLQLFNLTHDEKFLINENNLYAADQPSKNLPLNSSHNIAASISHPTHLNSTNKSDNKNSTSLIHSNLHHNTSDNYHEKINNNLKKKKVPTATLR